MKCHQPATIADVERIVEEKIIKHQNEHHPIYHVQEIKDLTINAACRKLCDDLIEWGVNRKKNASTTWYIDDFIVKINNKRKEFE